MKVFYLIRGTQGLCKEGEQKRSLNNREKVLKLLLRWVKTYPKDFLAESILRLLVDKWAVKTKSSLSVSGEGETKEREEEIVSLFEQFQKALLQADADQKAKVEALRREEEERRRKEEDRKEEERKMNIDSSKEVSHDGLLHKYSPAMVAQQLTLVDHKLFSKIEFQEFFNCSWTKEQKNELSPNLVKFIDRFNQV